MQKRIQKETLTKSKGFLTITVKPNLAAFRQTEFTNKKQNIFAILNFEFIRRHKE